MMNGQSSAHGVRRMLTGIEPSKTGFGGILGVRSTDVNNELQDLRDAGYKPVLVGPRPFSFENILRNVDPAPDEETERFVATIYADRHQSVEDSSAE